MNYPVQVEFQGVKILVVGGGSVGLRRGKTLAAAGAIVTLVDPARPPELPGDWDYRREPFAESHLPGQQLALACATPAVNAEVVRLAKARGVWVSDCITPSAGTVSFLATGSVGPVQLAVGTSGASPFLARRILDELVASLDPTLTEWVVCLQRVRQDVLASGLPESGRRALFARLTADEWRERIRDLGQEAALRLMRGELDALIVATAESARRRVDGEHGHEHRPDADE